MKLETGKFYVTKNGLAMRCANTYSAPMATLSGYAANMLSMSQDIVGEYRYQCRDGRYMEGIESGLDIEREITEDEALAIAALNG